jgi:hypothetical protein
MYKQTSLKGKYKKIKKAKKIVHRDGWIMRKDEWIVNDKETIIDLSLFFLFYDLNSFKRTQAKREGSKKQGRKRSRVLSCSNPVYFTCQWSEDPISITV